MYKQEDIAVLTNKNNLIAEQSVEWSVLLTEFEQSVSDQLKGLRVLECLLDCKTVVFFLKIREKNSVKRGVRLTRASLTCP